MKRLRAVLLVLVLPLPALADNLRISVGPVVRVGMEAELGGSGHANTVTRAHMPGRNSRIHMSWMLARRPDASSVAAPTDDITQYANRSFDDGFVNVSPPTEPSGVTWYWGFNDASQYDAQAQTFAFTRATSISAQGVYTDRREGRQYVTTVSGFDCSAWGSEEFNAAGLQVVLDYGLESNRAIQLDVFAALSALWGEGIRLEGSTYAADVTENRYATHAEKVYGYQFGANYVETYTYDDPAGLGGMLTPPYAGTEAGPGPVVPALPSERAVSGGVTVNDPGTLAREQSGRTLTGARTWDVRNAVRVDAEINSFALQIGGRALWPAGNWLTLFLQPRLSLNYVTAGLTRHEELYVASQTVMSWLDRKDDDAWVPGAGMAVGASFESADGWFADLSIGYEWMLDKPEFSVGPSKIRVDLSGLEASAGVGKRF